MFPIVGKSRFVATFFPRDQLKIGSVDFYGTELLLARIVFVTGEIKNPDALVHFGDIKHFKIASGKLAFKLSLACQRILLVEAVKVEMSMSVAPARPDEAVPDLKMRRSSVTFTQPS